MTYKIKNKFYFILLSLLIFLIDQITKYIVSINYKSIINTDLIFFKIDYIKNYGAAFNLFSGSRIFLSIISIIISFLLVYFILNNEFIREIELLSYSFILGGTLGNGFDRINAGFVVDFINLKFINFPLFNIADISINVGLIIILYSFVKYKR